MRKGRERKSLASGDGELSDQGGFADDCRGLIADSKGRMQGKEVKRKFVRGERAYTEGKGRGEQGGGGPLSSKGETTNGGDGRKASISA